MMEIFKDADLTKKMHEDGHKTIELAAKHFDPILVKHDVEWAGSTQRMLAAFAQAARAFVKEESDGS